MAEEVERNAEAGEVVGEFLRRQREMYRGGSVEPVEEMLAEEIVWHVPGASPIAGDYRGREAVVGYFTSRRALAGGEIEITKHGELRGPDVVVQLADGRARLGGEIAEWRTVGVYRVSDGRIAEAWLVPLEQEQFDAVWSRAGGGR